MKSQILLLIIILTSCNSTKNGNYTLDSVDSKNTLNWPSVYNGTLPCADCPGIEVELILNQDETYQLSTVYLEKSKNVFKENGTFSWNANGNIITLNIDGKPSPDHQYMIMESKIMKLDNKGNVISGALKENYILSKKINNNVVLNEDEYIYWVNSVKVECSGVGKMSCMQVQKNKILNSKDWKLFYSAIKGFNFEAGYIYKLIVKEIKRAKNQVPADASSINYELVKVLEKIKDNKMRLHDIWALQAVNGKEINVKNYNQRPNLEINLTSNRVMGNDGCNNFSGEIKQVDSKSLSFKPLIGTKKACFNMKFSNEISNILNNVETYNINNLTLSLYNKEGKEVLRYKKVD